MEDKVDFQLAEQVKLLQEQLAETWEHHEDTVWCLVEKNNSLRFELNLQREWQDTADKLAEIKYWLYNLCQLVLSIGTQLIAWEKHTSMAGLEDQLAETQCFIGSVSSQLWDGAHETVEQHHRWTGHDNELCVCQESVTLGGRWKSGMFYYDEDVKCEVRTESERRSESGADKWSRLGFSSCAAPFPMPKARFREVTD
ncbi:hypothetical protein B0H10DRAFT_1951036 [Mycena sp. CBHHK59/15]|nr:hypothetical protein B0H10DRAFT_1951036 [Mycena sp. CBHHK59/15]